MVPRLGPHDAEPYSRQEAVRSRKRAAQTALTTRDSVLAKPLFAGGHNSSPGCSASSASSDGSYRTGGESAAYYPRSTTPSGTPRSSVSPRR